VYGTTFNFFLGHLHRTKSEELKGQSHSQSRRFHQRDEEIEICGFIDLLLFCPLEYGAGMEKQKKAKILLKGSCHCGAVKFSVKSSNVYPYQRCYCSICRKTQGSGGYGIDISGDARTFKVRGKQNVSIYHAVMRERGKRPYRSKIERYFCKKCGSALWHYDKRWPDLIHPTASAIDTPLPVPPEHTHVLLKYKASWVEPHVRKDDQQFKEYPEESIAEWHDRNELTNSI
jgi:hypothetical protein